MFMLLQSLPQQGALQSASTSDKNIKPPFSNPNDFMSSFLKRQSITPPNLNQSRFNSPTPSQNIFSPRKPDQTRINLPLLSKDNSKPSPLGNYTPNYLRPASSSSNKKDDKVPSQTKDPEDYTDLAKLIDSANGIHTKKPNEVIQASQNNPSLPEGTKLITRNGQQHTVSLPKEIPVQIHSYENPVGLTKDEVRDIRNQVFKYVNLYRRRHGCNALTLNENVNIHNYILIYLFNNYY